MNKLTMRYVMILLMGSHMYQVEDKVNKYELH